MALWLLYLFSFLYVHATLLLTPTDHSPVRKVTISGTIATSTKLEKVQRYASGLIWIHHPEFIVSVLCDFHMILKVKLPVTLVMKPPIDHYLACDFTCALIMSLLWKKVPLCRLWILSISLPLDTCSLTDSIEFNLTTRSCKVTIIPCIFILIFHELIYRLFIL